MSRRTSVYLKGFRHKNPIPNACCIGNLLMSGIILGMDPETESVAETLERQCELMFLHVRDTVEQAGGTVDDIIKMTVWLKDRNQRQPVNAEWLKMFPDPRNRPARQAVSAPDLADGVLVQCDIVAVID
ncbi:MAG: RidA family protein [Deltaproteobacteria bacterium]|nr:RidA family protein [Deltaproteobacteria bacterium]